MLGTALLAFIAVAAARPATPEEARAEIRSFFRGDPPLQHTPVTIRETDRPLGELVANLGRELGVPLPLPATPRMTGSRFTSRIAPR